MSDNERGEIAERLTKLETIVEQKWLSHDKRADERWTDLMDKIHEMQASRTCVEHAGLLIRMDKRIESCEKWQTAVNWALGVIYTAVVGMLIAKIM